MNIFIEFQIYPRFWDRILIVFFILCMEHAAYSERAPIGALLVTPPKQITLADTHTGSVTIISSDEISKTTARNLGELLKNTAGVYVQSYGGVSAMRVVSIRGSSNEQVMVLYNGRKMNREQGGGVDFSSINLDNVERIEILKGPSVIYGTEALGGIVNIITKKGDDTSSKRTCSLSYGSFDTKRFTYSMQKQIEKKRLYYFLSGNLLHADDDYSFTDVRRNTTRTRENAGIESYGIAGNVGYYISDDKNAAVDVSWNAQRSVRGVPGMVEFPSVDAEEINSKEFFQLSFAKSFTHAYITDTACSVYYNRLNRHYTDPLFYLGVIDDSHKNTSFGGDAQLSMMLTASQFFQTGCALRNNHLVSTTDGDQQRSQTSLYGKYTIHCGLISSDVFGNRLSWTELTTGIRYEEYSGFPGIGTPQAGIIQTLREDGTLKVKMNWATSYRVPSFDDLFWPATAFAEGNSDLRPERGNLFETGFIMQPEEMLTFEIYYFYNTVTDLIQWVPGAFGRWRPHNIGKAVLSGIELEKKIKYFFVSSDIFLRTLFNYTYLSAENRTPDPATKYKQLIRRPEHKITGMCSLGFKEKYHISLTGRYISKRYITAANTKWIEPYTVFDAAAELRFMPQAIFSVVLRNVTDKDYIEVDEFPIPGREYEVSIKYTF